MDHRHFVLWMAFGAIAFAIMVGDLFFIHKKSRKASLREALLWSCLCIALALGYVAAIFCLLGEGPAVSWLTAYLVEQSLSVDNLFVFLLIFRSFQVDDAYQHRLLFWGVIGAIVLRFLMIFFGIALVGHFRWILYVFGALLFYLGIKLVITRTKAPATDPGHHIAVRQISRLLPLTQKFHDGRFWVREEGRLKATSLVLVLITIECTDLLFAIDSIPAVFGISQDFFIILTSNIFAIIALRSLFFVLAGFVGRMRVLNYDVALSLILIGAKMMIVSWVTISDLVSLGVIAGVLGVFGAVSLLWPRSPGTHQTLRG